jgi:Rieske Fe-S protein
MQVPIPPTPGTYVTHREGGLDIVLARLAAKAGGRPPAALPVSGGDCVVAFSRKCTHMGCFLLPEAASGAMPLPDAGGLVRCPCHSSCFDVTKKGLVIGGPATEWLPLHEIRPVLDSAGQVTAVEHIGWNHRWGDVGRGVPYGGTDAKPDGV